MARRRLSDLERCVTRNISVFRRHDQWLSSNSSSVNASALFRAMLDDIMAAAGDDYRASQLASEYAEGLKHLDDLKREFETRMPGQSIEAFNAERGDPEAEKIRKLWEALDAERRSMIDDPASVRFLVSWLETRSADFGLVLPPMAIVERLRIFVSTKEGCKHGRGPECSECKCQI